MSVRVLCVVVSYEAMNIVVSFHLQFLPLNVPDLGPALWFNGACAPPLTVFINQVTCECLLGAAVVLADIATRVRIYKFPHLIGLHTVQSLLNMPSVLRNF